MVRITGGAVVMFPCGSSSRTIVSRWNGRAFRSGRASGGCAATLVPVEPPVVVPVVVPAVLEDAGGSAVRTGGSVLRLLLLLAAVLVSDSVVFSVAFSVVFWVAFLCLRLRLCGNKSGCLRLTFTRFSLCLQQPANSGSCHI